MILDWQSIRPLNGGQDKGFEELCAQLARAESHHGARFERKGTPDAGVECYSVLSDGSEWAWQAKYFHALGDSQWSQLDKSVKTAIEKHPRLVRYFVCIPLDRPDARIDGRKSAKAKWDEHVKKWTKQAADKDMAVEFVYWGSHELLERLAHPKHVGRVRFWFDARGFDAAWFTARFGEARSTAGPRYSPELHLDLPIALELEAFGRTDCFFEREKAHARTIREKLKTFEYSSGGADADIHASVAALSAKVHGVLDSMGAITTQPTGSLPFKAIAEQITDAKHAAEGLSRLLDERGRALEATPDPTDTKAHQSYRSSPFRDRLGPLRGLTSALSRTRESLVHADAIAGSALMLLRGAAGTGKTHLLCDFTRQRTKAGLPTVLLMGQQFVSHDAPWSQALQQLDLTGLSAEEFVGALEAAAQASGSRALLIVDAINEGSGRVIWPNHLAAFLAHLERSPWIGVLLAIRSSYEEIIVPAEVRERAATVTHHGFTGLEYDATKEFFVHYGIELPSTPLLAPEFQNPLFLKTLCLGLNAKGERRLPRGFQGITAVFDLYLSAINGRLASNLGFDARTSLAFKGVEALVRAFVDSGENWLTLAKAAEIVNEFLPGRDYERSLYHGLVVEGVLVEDVTRHDVLKEEVVVFIGYERFADHLAAKALLDRHLDGCDPVSAFAGGGPLAFICDPKRYVSPGLLEALCIQIPERTGQELICLAPTCKAARRGLGKAFRESLIWRAHSAFSEGTRDALNELDGIQHSLYDTLEVLLTVATLPGHPLNARFLDLRLRKDVMPDRDAWWSVYLHQAWRTQGAVDRLVDWASSVEANTAIDDEALDLCALTLAWMLTTSNRFLRDRATKALVNLLSNRLVAAARLAERFADVDDPYVTERVYAVAYGVAMRAQDPAEVGALAACIYKLVLASGSPPPHILLRDYARGVVERALHLGSAIEVVADRFRPPYKSKWPTIPTEEDIKPFLSDPPNSSYTSGKMTLSRYRIAYSVMEGDFARYVIGTNFAWTSSGWLSLRLNEPPWKLPSRPENRWRSWVGEFSTDELQVWEGSEAAGKAHAAPWSPVAPDPFAQFEKNATSSSVYQELEEKTRKSVSGLESGLAEEDWQDSEEMRSEFEAEPAPQCPPRFELRQIQRYILKRVFDLGWTEERFGHFDRSVVESGGREASKAERIGKKYQWLAYHEIMALVSDHFQYLEEFREEEGDYSYEGPWQDSLRDIDPSCTMRSGRESTSRDSQTASWWEPARYDHWGDLDHPRDWVLDCEDLPKVEELLIVTDPEDGTRWLNAQGHFNWTEQPPADREPTDVENRELWYTADGYLVRADDARSFLEWAEGVDFWGRWMPEAALIYRIFLGEHPWAPAARYFQKPGYGDDGWTQPRYGGCPVKIRTVTFEYLREVNDLDCSVDESFTLRLPVSDLATGLGIRWSGRGASFVDAAGGVAAQDPTVFADGPSALLFRVDPLQEFLDRNGLTICWAVLGEKRILSPGVGTGPFHPALRMSGAYVLSEGRVQGFMKRMLYDPSKEQQKSSYDGLEVINVIRSAV